MKKNILILLTIIFTFTTTGEMFGMKRKAKDVVSKNKKPKLEIDPSQYPELDFEKRECKKCKKQFPGRSRQLLVDHWNHFCKPNPEVLQCPKCLSLGKSGEGFPDQRRLDQHIDRCPGLKLQQPKFDASEYPELNFETLTCKCKTLFTREDRLVEHWNYQCDANDNRIVLFCRKCKSKSTSGKGFSNESKRDQHEKNCTGKQKKYTKVDPSKYPELDFDTLTCKKCKKQYLGNARQILIEHWIYTCMPNHIVLKCLKCKSKGQSGEGFPNKRSLLRHEESCPGQQQEEVILQEDELDETLSEYNENEQEIMLEEYELDIGPGDDSKFDFPVPETQQVFGAIGHLSEGAGTAPDKEEFDIDAYLK